jgi:hypothetical protein
MRQIRRGDRLKLIIAGSRGFTFLSSPMIDAFLQFHHVHYKNIEQVVSGCAPGVDTAGENFAAALDIDIETFPANWNKHGKAAGPMRNKEMAEYADALLLIWDGKSKGSANMKQNMLKLNKPIYEVILSSYNVPVEPKT